MPKSAAAANFLAVDNGLCDGISFLVSAALLFLFCFISELLLLVSFILERFASISSFCFAVSLFLSDSLTGNSFFFVSFISADGISVCFSSAVSFSSFLFSLCFSRYSFTILDVSFLFIPATT